MNIDKPRIRDFVQPRDNEITCVLAISEARVKTF
jgi:hypothetical protein